MQDDHTQWCTGPAKIIHLWGFCFRTRTEVRTPESYHLTRHLLHFRYKLGHCSVPSNGVTNLTVPLNSTGSWGIMESLLRRSAKPMSFIFTPSILMQPPDSSTRRKSAIPREDFPKNEMEKQDQCFFQNHNSFQMRKHFKSCPHLRKVLKY